MKNLSIIAFLLSSSSFAAASTKLVIPKLVFPISGMGVEDINQKFGDLSSSSVCKKEPGISLMAPDGTHIYAVLDGEIAWIGDIFYNDGFGGTGPYGIIIDHGSNLYTIYGHNRNAAPDLKIGDQVVAGHHIVDVGRLGYASGSVLYFRMIFGVPLSKDVRDGKFTPRPFGDRIKTECPHYIDPMPLFR